METESARSYKYVEGFRNKPWRCRINLCHEFKRTGQVRVMDVELPDPPYLKRIYEFPKRCVLCGKEGRADIGWEKNCEG